MENRLGKIRISESVLYSEFARILFAQFIPISIVQDSNNPTIAIYTGMCEQFEEIGKDFDIPFYNAVIEVDNQKVILKFDR